MIKDISKKQTNKNRHCYNRLRFALENRGMFNKSSKLPPKNSPQSEF